MKRNYELLSYEAVIKMAEYGDKDAHLELARRHTETATQLQLRAEPQPLPPAQSPQFQLFPKPQKPQQVLPPLQQQQQTPPPQQEPQALPPLPPSYEPPRVWQADEEQEKQEEQRGEIMSKGPVPRTPLLWFVFIFYLLWEKTRVFIEPACICLLLYGIYTLTRKVFFVDHYWHDDMEMAQTYVFAIIIVFLLSKVANIWLRIAWARRPLTIFLVIGGIVCWYDGIWLM